MTWTMAPIGTIHTPFLEQSGTPIQSRYGRETRGSVELLPEYEAALADLVGFERIWLLFVLDRARPWRSSVVPYRDKVPRGLFSTRAPSRPCPVGMSAVELLSVEGCRLEIRGVDMLDGTPLLDIKPYIPRFDAFPDSRAGWFDESRERAGHADGRFSSE